MTMAPSANGMSVWGTPERQHLTRKQNPIWSRQITPLHDATPAAIARCQPCVWLQKGHGAICERPGHKPKASWAAPRLALLSRGLPGRSPDTGSRGVRNIEEASVYSGACEQNERRGFARTLP